MKYTLTITAWYLNTKKKRGQATFWLEIKGVKSLFFTKGPVQIYENP